MTRTLLSALLLLAACPMEPQACDLMAVSSVAVTVNDEAGNPKTDAMVRFSLDGGAFEDCESLQPGSYVCGWERHGSFEITVEAAGYDSETFTVEVEDGVCHPISEVLTVNLVPACDDPPPALLLTVLDPDSTPADGETVAWAPMGTDGIPTPCEAMTDGTWACAHGVAGDLDVYVTPAAGDPYAPLLETYAVTEGACGPETRSETLTFDYLPD